MAGELTQEINQLKIKINSAKADIKSFEDLLTFAESINKGDVSPELEASLKASYQALLAQQED